MTIRYHSDIKITETNVGSTVSMLKWFDGVQNLTRLLSCLSVATTIAGSRRHLTSRTKMLEESSINACCIIIPSSSPGAHDTGRDDAFMQFFIFVTCCSFQWIAHESEADTIPPTLAVTTDTTCFGPDPCIH